MEVANSPCNMYISSTRSSIKSWHLLHSMISLLERSKNCPLIYFNSKHSQYPTLIPFRWQLKTCLLDICRLPDYQVLHVSLKMILIPTKSGHLTYPSRSIWFIKTYPNYNRIPSGWNLRDVYAPIGKLSKCQVLVYSTGNDILHTESEHHIYLDVKMLHIIRVLTNTIIKIVSPLCQRCETCIITIYSLSLYIFYWEWYLPCRTGTTCTFTLSSITITHSDQCLWDNMSRRTLWCMYNPIHKLPIPQVFEYSTENGTLLAPHTKLT
jgi:hypothetical protein